MFSLSKLLRVKPVFLLFLLFQTNISAQQNLVVNGGFEEYYSCPQSNDVNNGQFELCKGWWKPTKGTPDYFNRCSGSTVGIPNNFWGFQEAFDGNGYVGLVPSEWQIINGVYIGFEYIQTRLLQPLSPCSRYSFEMHVNFANYSRFGISKLGALFSEAAVTSNDPYSLVAAPQILNSTGILSDTVAWVTITGNFVAQGGEEYLTIGYFFNSVTDDTLRFQEPSVSVDTGYEYYYIDNVVVKWIETIDGCEFTVPNVFTPNSDGINDLWTLVIPTEGSLQILNRWGNVVYSAIGTVFNWDGSDCTDGVYFYNVVSDSFSKTGFIEVVR